MQIHCETLKENPKTGRSHGHFVMLCDETGRVLHSALVTGTLTEKRLARIEANYNGWNFARNFQRVLGFAK